MKVRGRKHGTNVQRLKIFIAFDYIVKSVRN